MEAGHLYFYLVVERLNRVGQVAESGSHQHRLVLNPGLMEPVGHLGAIVVPLAGGSLHNLGGLLHQLVGLVRRVAGRHLVASVVEG